MVAQFEASQRTEEFEVYACNQVAVEAFLVVQTQLRREGFLYEGVRAGLGLAGIESTPELFDQLRIMEISIVNFMGQRERDARGK